MAEENEVEVGAGTSDIWRGNVQWEVDGVRLNLRLTGVLSFDSMQLDNITSILEDMDQRGFTRSQKQESPAANSVGAPMCPVHAIEMRHVPAGTNKQGRAYGAFWSCPNYDCNQKSNA